MTRSEIQLVVFIVGALVLGALVQHWRAEHPAAPPPPTAAPSNKWAKPPYVFKNRKEMEQAAKNVEAEQNAYVPKNKLSE